MARTNKIRDALSLSAVILLLAAAAHAADGEPDWKFTSSLNYETGKYGSDTRTSSLYVPLTLKRYIGEGYASLTLPYLSQTSDGRVTNVGGRPMQVRRGATSRTTTTESGMGDMVLRGGYTILKEKEKPFDLDLVGRIKVPTADKDKGLGTGEFDEGVGIEFGKALTPEWTILVDLYYTVIGDPPGTNLKNQTSIDAGFSHVLRPNLDVTVLFEGSNALVPGQPDPRDARAMLDYRLTDRVSLFGGGLVGLSHGSPDYGLSAGGSIRF